SILKEIVELTNRKSIAYSNDWSEEVIKLNEKYSKELAEYRIKLQRDIEDIQLLQNKVESQKNLTKKYKELEDEQTKQKQIEKQKKQIQDSLSNIRELKDILSSLTADFYSIYLEAKDNVTIERSDEELIF